MKTVCLATAFRACGWVLVLLSIGPPAAAEGPIVRIGVVVDGPWALNDAVRELTEGEITALTDGEFDVRFPEEAFLTSDWTLASVEANMRRLLADPEIDLVIAWGLVASHSACCLGELPKPVIAPVVLDARLQGLPYADGASGVHHLSYVALPDALARELARFRGIVPFGHVAILCSESLLDAIPELVERTRAGLASTGVDFEYVPAGTSADAVLEALSPEVDAVYVWPLFQFSAAEYRRLIDGLIERRLPGFSGLGGSDVEAGMLASAAPPDFFPRLARRIALTVQRILLGEDAGDLPVSFDMRENLVINMATARAIGASPRWEMLVEADLLHAEVVEGAYELSLDKAVVEAVALNLDLLARRREIAAGAEEVTLARSSLRPRLDLSATSVTIDDDRAAASLGSQAERTLTGSAGVRQLLYSEPALGNVAIQRRLQKARELDLETLELDLALEAATTYLNLMRAKALERVQRNNVDRTRSNLEISRERRDIGVASAGEVLRWESQIATARKTLVEAAADRRSAEIAVNRLLHRPQDSPFLTAEVDLDEPDLLPGGRPFHVYLDTPAGYEPFREFVVLEGLARSPELARIDAAIEAQNRLAISARRAYWAPTVGWQAAWDELLSRGGAGTGGTGDPPFAFPLPDETSWSVGVSASLPLFEGGARRAELVQAEADLERLGLERAATEEKIEQRIRSALEQARASYIGISLSDRAAAAAAGNLELVEDSYARGAASLLDLLDAQTNALNAEELAANALYDFLLDLLEAKRAASAILEDENERYDFERRLGAHLTARGVALPPLERE
ncbi:MAG: TolC family protein [Acidobacteriota bacterium]|nr:TolC family protein [Acidobacteriota bacterium]